MNKKINMKKGIIKFVDILGDNGKKYDIWLDSQIEGYYLTYKENIYSDKYMFAIQRYGCISEPAFLTNDIKEITEIIDKQILKEKKKNERCER